MKIYAVVLVLTGLLIACNHSDDPQYKNYERWVISDWSHRPLNGAPKEVKEISYTGLSDTSFLPPPKIRDYRICRFDEDGNLVYIYTFLDSSYMFEQHKMYNPEGIRTRSYSYDRPGGEPVNKIEETSEKIGKSKYRITRSDKNESMPYDEIETYSDDGLTIEYRQHEKQFGSVFYQYKNDRLEYAKKIREKDTTENVYYYSTKGFLDSIAASKSGVRKEVKVYINNAQGDPLEVTESGKTVRFKYEYDAKGNWVKLLMYDPEPGMQKDTTSKFPGYLLFVREIKY
jgi:hypothetical protein